MENKIKILEEQNIQNKIHLIRDLQVILDRGLAELYDVKTRRLREQVKRNIDRFPSDFMFQLNKNEVEYMVSQNAIPSKQSLGGSLPYVFTEQGVASISGVLTNKTAIEINITIMRTFVQMRKFINNNASIFQRLDNIEEKQITTDNKFEKVFNAIEAKEIKQEEGIFYNGKVFDAYAFIAKLVKEANKSVILVDNYIDERVLLLLSKRKDKCKAIIYTEKVNKQLKLDLDKHHKQYRYVEIKIIKKIHDRFLIIDKNEIYHNGASIKNLGESLFAITRMDKRNLKILDVLKEAKDYK